MTFDDFNTIMSRVKQEAAFLDTLDLLPIFKTVATETWTVHDYMQYIEDHYIDEYNKIYPDADFIFNYMDSYEFAGYIKDRYGINTREVTECYFDT